MRIKLITNRETINYFKEKFDYLLFKNGHHNSGITGNRDDEYYGPHLHIMDNWEFENKSKQK